MMNDKDREEILEMLKKTAHKAGELVMQYKKNSENLKIYNKESAGLASSADIESEKIIKDELLKIEKKMSFQSLLIAEEDSFLSQGHEVKIEDKKRSPFVWLIDPLDGTTNFLTGLDYYAISLALVEKGRSSIGVVYRPETGDCFYAIKGWGAYICNLRKSVEPVKMIKDIRYKGFKAPPQDLSQSVLTTGFAVQGDSGFKREFEIFKKMMEKSRAVRRMGSAALDICHTATGIFDGFWERGLAAWDVAASSLICSESGLMVTDYDGREFDVFGETIIVAPEKTHHSLKQIILS